MAHNEHCKKCKSVFINALRKEFGEVTEQWKSGWPCRIDDILGLSEINNADAAMLRKIYNSLQNHRGHHDFVRKKILPACDYYIKSLNCLLEFDESQHFTALRGLTLSLYPKKVKLGYDKKLWRKRCEEMDRHDNDPIDRDEKRAWYDTLRDLLPLSFGINPTIRIFSKDAIWCEDKNKTMDLIKSIIEKGGKKKMTKRIQKSVGPLNFVKVQKSHVKRAIQKLLKDGWKGFEAKSTEILYEGELLPAKHVLRIAYKLATNKKTHNKLTGGDASAKILYGLGFDIIKNGNCWQPYRKKKGRNLFRVYLKGTYNRKKKEHFNHKFKKWVSKPKNKLEFNRLESIFDKIEYRYGSLSNSIVVFPACSIVVNGAKEMSEWKSKVRKKFKKSMIIIGVMDTTKPIDCNELTAIWNNGKYFELHPYEPKKKLPGLEAFAYNSSSIGKLREKDHVNYDSAGKFCFDLGHGAYTARYGNTLRSVSEKNKLRLY